MSFTQSFEDWCEGQSTEEKYAEMKEATELLHFSAYYAKLCGMSADEWAEETLPRLKTRGGKVAQMLVGNIRIKHLKLYIWR